LTTDRGLSGSKACCFETNLDLAGNPAPERLIVYAGSLVVLGKNGLPDSPRQWRRDAIEDFRVEPSVGSCFLQVQVEGRWRDILRRAGNADPPLNKLLERLNDWRRCEDDHDGSQRTRPLAGKGSSTAPWPSGHQEAPARGQKWHMAGRLLTLMRPFRISVLLLLGLSLGAVAIEVVPPMLQRLMVDRVLDAKPPRGGTQALLMLLLAIVAGLLLVRLASAWVTIWKGHISSHVGSTLTANLRNALVKKFNELPLAYYDHNQVGMLMSRVAYDTETLHTLIYHMTSGLLLQALQLLGIGVMLCYLNPKLAVVTMLPMPLIVGGSWYFTHYLNPRYQHYWEAVGKQASALLGMLSGMRVVKAFVQEDHEIERFCQSSRRLRDSRQTVDSSTSTFTSLMGLLFALGGLAVWYIGGSDVLFGRMTLGSLMAFLMYLAMFYAPLTSIAESTNWFSSFFTTSRRIFEVLDTPGEQEADSPIVGVSRGDVEGKWGQSPGSPGEREDAEPARPLDRVRGRLQFQDVSFGYDKNRPVLKEVSFTVEPGQMIGVVGRSGSGKSTLVSLIGRLYEIDAGRILIDGADTRAMAPRQLRRQIGMVLQEPFLFRAAVADNIAYGDRQATPEQILRAARHADAHDYIMQMPLAYENQLGEGGSGLSGGERQRLSIARALLLDPPILILDEATASVDAESERAICDAIRRLARKRTTLVIAHRLSTLRDADRLLVFDQGRLIEQGSHDELLAEGGLYSTLARLQSNLKESGRRIDGLLGGAINGDAWDDGVRSESDGTAREIQWLDPATAAIGGDGQGTLRVTTHGQCSAGLYAVRAFPASHPRSFLSLRRREPSGREVEVGMLAALEHWPTATQADIDRLLARRYLLRRIEEIRQLRTSGNRLTFAVETQSGPARFQLEKPGEGFQPFGKRGLLLVDAVGNYYVIPDRDRLPKHQQRLLTLYFGE
jgi:ATP-binding cassette subfamily B protein